MKPIVKWHNRTIENHNPAVGELYRLAMHEEGNAISASGALISYSGEKTGRSPKDKRIVVTPDSEDDIWWGDINIKLSKESFEKNKKIAVDFLEKSERLFAIDGFAGWDTNYQIKARILCTRAYHALFMWNMLIRPTIAQLEHFGDPDWTVYNAGVVKADTSVEGVETETSVTINFETKEVVILGTEYAGEMKKGIFTVLNYLLPKRGVLAMHCSANEGMLGDTALFFGLSGTGKTTLSADPNRNLIGDDEHGWSDEGIFNFEGGCYAKTIDISEDTEPEIYHAIHFGSLLENVVMDPDTGNVDYTDSSITENTRCSYPIDFIEHCKKPCIGGHPRNIIFLTCDAFGVLPPVSKLTPEQAMYHFISGYTAKVAGTEQGVTEPKATFSACFGAAFMVWHPTVYANLLAEKIKKHDAHVWLVNTGWIGGPYGVGRRIPLKFTRTIIDAIMEGLLEKTSYITDRIFGIEIPSRVKDVPVEILTPSHSWDDRQAYQEQAIKLAKMYVENFKRYQSEASPELLAAAPKTSLD